jgi:hypothetical protein
MTKYTVEVTRSITASVEVEAASPEAAIETANRQDFELPPRDEWSGAKDWEYAVFGPDGNELGRDDGDGYYETTYTTGQGS